MAFELRRTEQGWTYYCLPELEEQGIVHGFFTKKSPPADAFPEERDFCEVFALRNVIIMDQEHKDEVHLIRKGERPLSGDGILLMERNVAGIIKTADCLPVIIIEPTYPMAAIVHAGWRGTALKITGKAAEMMAALGAAREKMTALLGPSIRACCYEVGKEVIDVFRREGFSESVFHVMEGGATHLDLTQANRELLSVAGVGRIVDTGLCTYCRNDLFASYRRGDRTGRQISFVSLRG